MATRSREAGQSEEEDGELTTPDKPEAPAPGDLTACPGPAAVGNGPVGASPRPEVLGHTCRARVWRTRVCRCRNEPPVTLHLEAPGGPRDGHCLESGEKRRCRHQRWLEVFLEL